MPALGQLQDKTQNLKTIHYSSVKHTQVLFRYDYMFQSKNSIIIPTLQKEIEICCNTVQLCSLCGCILPRFKSFVMLA